MSAATAPIADDVVALFPGALGDLICFLPTLRALRARHGGRMLVVAKSDLLELIALPNMTAASIDRREVADLFATESLSPRTSMLFGGYAHAYSWTGFGDRNFISRLARACGGDVRTYAFRGMHSGEHAVDYYARCVGLTPVMPATADIVEDADWLATFERTHHLTDRPILVMHPGSGAPRKNWQAFDAVANHWHRHHREAVVVLHGPAERAAQTPTGKRDIRVDALSLPQVAALLHRATLYLGNDSGISHLAGAVGAHGVVVFGPSDPAVWAPRSATLKILQASAACTRCAADTFCVHRLPVAPVIRALEAQHAAATMPSQPSAQA